MKKIKHIAAAWNKMCEHTSVEQILCFFGFIGIILLGFCYICYNVIIANFL